jgi:lipopolysaccharide export system permease protein
MFALSRYIALQVILGLLLALSVLTVLVGLIDFVELSRTVGTIDGVRITDLFPVAILRLPALAEDTFPFVFLFGTMWAIARLNRRSELIAMRAGGMSAWMFLRPVLIIALLAGVLMTTVFNPAAADLFSRAQSLQSGYEESRNRQITLSDSGVWLRESDEEGQVVIHAQQARAGGREISDVTVYIYGRHEDGRQIFARRLDAASARLIGGFWQFDDVLETEPDSPPVRHTSLSLETRLEPGRLIERSENARSLTFWQLPAFAQQLEISGFAARDYWLTWWKLLATPLVFAAMGTIAVAVSMSLTRSGGTMGLAIVGVIAGFTVFFADSFVSAFGSTGVSPASVSALFAPTVALLGGLYFIAKLEDG